MPMFTQSKVAAGQQQESSREVTISVKSRHVERKSLGTERVVQSGFRRLLEQSVTEPGLTRERLRCETVTMSVGPYGTGGRSEEGLVGLLCRGECLRRWRKVRRRPAVTAALMA